MNTPVPPPLQPRRSYLRWVLLGLAIFALPFVFVGVAAWSILTLDRDAAMLRREVMAASDANWHTKVQLSAGWVTLGAVRTGLRLIQAEHMDEARLAMKAVRSASVGVYECNHRMGNLSSSRLFADADKRMRARGWTRLVGVRENNQTVLVYASDDLDAGGRMDLCVAVVDGDKLVIVSTNVDTDALARLAEMKMPPGGFYGKLRLAKLGL